MNSSAFGSRSLSRKGEGSMALKSCLSWPTETSMRTQSEGIGSPAALAGATAASELSGGCTPWP
jgi:hypothetical protein